MPEVGWPPPPYQKHSDTSKAASDQIAPVAGRCKALVYEYIVAAPNPVSDEEGAVALNMNPSTYRPRRIDLEREELICKVLQVTTASGRKAWAYAAYDTPSC